MRSSDLDVSTTVAVDDFASQEELWVLVDTMRMGPPLIAYVVNTGFGIMLRRYPHELVLAPFAPGSHLRTIFGAGAQ